MTGARAAILRGSRRVAWLMVVPPFLFRSALRFSRSVREGLTRGFVFREKVTCAFNRRQGFHEHAKKKRPDLTVRARRISTSVAGEVGG